MGQKEKVLKFLSTIYSGDADELDGILHEDYLAPKYLTKEDRNWYKLTSWLNVILEREPKKADDESLKVGFLPPGIENTKERIRNRSIQYDVNIFQIIEENNIVIVCYNLKGIHSASLYGINPTWSEINFQVTRIIEFKDGKIIKAPPQIDVYKILKDIGGFLLEKGNENQIELYLENLKKQKLIP